jgi:tryptophanyl-tRNA synthetase
MRTTGPLHLGHYVGALKNWAEVQDQGYECFFLLADVQAMTTHADNPALLTASVKEVVLDWLSVGLDPTRSNVHFVLQSQVPERYELSVLLSMIAPFSRVMLNPTLKAELAKQAHPTLGFVCYPVDQTADIEMVSPLPREYGDELLVPVGEDQAPHLEDARDLVRRFNDRYNGQLMECRALIGEVGRLPGTDESGQKMSKSADNAIYLSDDAAMVVDKVRRMPIDPARKDGRHIPGNPDATPLFAYHRAFNPDKQQVADLEDRYRSATVGDAEVKRELARVLNEMLDPIRERRAQFEGIDFRSVLEPGTEVARAACRLVVEHVRERMHMTYPV